MIERLMNPERPYGEPQYSRLSEQIVCLRQQLIGHLEQRAQQTLEQLEDAYIRQGNVMLADAFADGFWSAVELMLEFQRRSSEGG